MASVSQRRCALFQTMATRVGTLGILLPEIRDEIYKLVVPPSVLVCYPEFYEPTKQELEDRRTVFALQIIDHEAIDTIHLRTIFTYQLNFSGVHSPAPSPYVLQRYTHIRFQIDFTNFLLERGPDGKPNGKPDSKSEGKPDGKSKEVPDGPIFSDFSLRRSIREARVLAAQTFAPTVKAAAHGKTLEIEYHGLLDEHNDNAFHISSFPTLHAYLIPSGFFQPLKRMCKFSTVTIKFLGELFPCDALIYTIMSDHQWEFMEAMRKQLIPALGPADPISFTKKFDPNGMIKMFGKIVFHPHEHCAAALDEKLEKFFPGMSVA